MKWYIMSHYLCETLIALRYLVHQISPTDLANTENSPSFFAPPFLDSTLQNFGPQKHHDENYNGKNL